MVGFKSIYVLMMFSFFAMTQAAVWFVFSSVPAASSQYYNLSDSEIALLLNWGCIMYIIVAIPVMSAFSTASPVTVRRYVRFAAFLIFAGNILRDIPTFVPSMHTVFDSSSSFTEMSSMSYLSESSSAERRGIPPTGAPAVIAKILLHIAQIFNAIAGPVVMSPVALISELYFTPNLYVLTTNLMFLANGFGLAIFFVVGPALAPDAQHIPALMLCQTALATVSFLMTFYFPLPENIPVVKKRKLQTNHVESDENNTLSDDSKENAPLLTESDGIDKGQSQEESACVNLKNVTVEFLRGSRTIFSNRNSAIATMCTGIQFGFVAGWASCLPTVLMRLGVDASTAGNLGIGETGASLASSLVFGIIATTPCLRTRYRSLSIFLWVLAVVCFVLVSLFIPYPWADEPVISPKKTALFGICFAGFGLFSGGLTPLYYEILAELTYPVSPSTSTGLVALISNFGSLVTVALSPVLNPSAFLACVLVVLFLCAILCSFFVKVRYVRREAQLTTV